jgi:hypothetical protein
MEPDAEPRIRHICVISRFVASWCRSPVGFGASGRWGFSLAVPATAARAARAKRLGPFRNWSRGLKHALLGLGGVFPTSAVRVLWAASAGSARALGAGPLSVVPAPPPSPCSSSRPRARGLVARARFVRHCPRPRPSRPRACLLPTARRRRSLVAPTRLPACSETKRAPLWHADQVFEPFSGLSRKLVDNY